MPDAPRTILQFRTWLKSMSQMEWRRVQVPSTMILARAFLAACIAEALQVMASRRAAGKVVIAVDSNSH
jgi:hypothetical protein